MSGFSRGIEDAVRQRAKFSIRTHMATESIFSLPRFRYEAGHYIEDPAGPIVRYADVMAAEISRAADQGAREGGDREALRQLVAQVQDALTDILSGWRYIRSFHGELYGVGWDRADDKAAKALEALAIVMAQEKQ